jgi:hypothetical protein
MAPLKRDPIETLEGEHAHLCNHELELQAELEGARADIQQAGAGEQRRHREPSEGGENAADAQPAPFRPAAARPVAIEHGQPENHQHEHHWPAQIADNSGSQNAAPKGQVCPVPIHHT